MDIYTPYTYLVGWSMLDKWYYGVRYAKDCHPKDLWVTYFTSSNMVKEIRETHGDPDVIQVRRVFENSKAATDWETRALKRMRVSKSERWLNISETASLRIPLIRTKTHNENIGKSHRGKKKSGKALDAAINNAKKAIEKIRGKSRPEHSAKMKLVMRELYATGKLVALSGKESPSYGKSHSAETKNKLTQAAHERKKIVCCIACHKPKADVTFDGVWMCHYINHHKDC